MNCRNFEDIVNDLARAQHGLSKHDLKLIDAATPEAGMAHAENCARCSARLADESALSAGLKSLAASDDRKVASTNLEASLLDAFRGQAPKPVTRRLPARPGGWRLEWSPRLALVAAAILIAFGFILYRANRNEPPKASDVITEKAPAPQPSVKPEEQLVKENGGPEPRIESPAPRPRRGNRPRRDRFFIRDSMTSYARDSEYTTDFFLLSYSDDPKPMESGEVIRVQMPRSALVKFGLPVNVERADTPVTADLLVGEDGLARAIRFVR